MNLDNFRYDILLLNRGLKVCLRPPNINQITHILPYGPSKILKTNDIDLPTEEQINILLFKNTKEGRFKIIKYLISKGANDLIVATRMAHRYKLDHLVDYFKSL